MSSSQPIIERPVPGNAACWWVLAYVALLPLPGLAEAVLAAGALFAVVRLLQLRAHGGIAPLLTVEAWGLTSLLFLAYWLPQALAAVDADNPGKALGKAVGALRYLPFMWLVAISVATAARRRRTFGGIALIAALWAVDAAVQAVTGASALLWLLEHGKQAVAGRALCTPAEFAAVGRVNGIFSECNPKLGQVLAVLAPFVLLLAGGRRWLWCLLALLVGAAVALAGARAAWISYALVLMLCGWRLLGRRGVLALAAVAVVGMAGLVALQPSLQARVASTAQVFGDQPGALDAALAGRGRIWAGAACMIAAHPVNGVGVRGFRQAWADCDPQPDVTAAWGDGPALHAHQLVLEVLAETGVIGLLLWLAGAALAIRAWRFADGQARARAWPAAVAAAVAVFPLNTHLAVYSAFWGGITLMLAALYVGALQARD